MAAFDKDGNVVKQIKFPTTKQYDEFLVELGKQIKNLGVEDFWAACVAAPAKISHERGSIIAGGNITWQNEPIQADIEHIVHAPVVLENDAKLAGLSEANIVKKDFKRVLYVTISTGIGTALILNGAIEPSMRDMEGGHMMLEHNGNVQTWESFASGKAIKAKYGKIAAEIEDPSIWKEIVRDFAIGFIDLIAVIQPEVIIIGGGVGSHFDKYGKLLVEQLKKYESPVVPIPILRSALRPEEAVVYGCYDLAREKYGHAHPKAA